MGPGGVTTNQIKKRNMIQQSSHSHNVGQSTNGAQGAGQISGGGQPSHHGQQVQSQALLDKPGEIILKK